MRISFHIHIVVPQLHLVHSLKNPHQGWMLLNLIHSSPSKIDLTHLWHKSLMALFSFINKVNNQFRLSLHGKIREPWGDMHPYPYLLKCSSAVFFRFWLMLDDNNKTLKINKLWFGKIYEFLPSWAPVEELHAWLKALISSWLKVKT